MALLESLVWIAGVLALLGLVSWRWYRIAHDADEIHYVTTADGQRIALLRYHPDRGATPRHHPPPPPSTPGPACQSGTWNRAASATSPIAWAPWNR